jgi:hypothetical protein
MKALDTVQGMANRQRIVLLALAVAVAVVAVVLIGSGGDDESDVIDTRTTATQQQTTSEKPSSTTTTTTEAEPAPAVPTIAIRDGKPAGGVKKLRFRKGGDIVFLVESDTAGEIHLHGYDVAKEVEAGGSVRFDVPATIDGAFEVEIEDTATPIAEIEVLP